MPVADIYLRVSTAKQAEGHGLVRQADVCRQWCGWTNTTIRSEITDVCSAYNGDHLNARSKSKLKGNLGRALLAWQSGEIAPPDLLVFEARDRLSRMDVSTNTQLLSDIRSLGIDLVSVFDSPEYLDHDEFRIKRSLVFHELQLSGVIPIEEMDRKWVDTAFSRLAISKPELAELLPS